MTTIVAILLILGFICFLVGVVREEMEAFVMGAGLLIFAVGIALGAVISKDEMRREAVKTGNAYYKQIIKDNGDVRNEFHWVNETKEKKGECKDCGK